MDFKIDNLSEQFFEKLSGMLQSNDAANPADADPEFWSRNLPSDEIDTFEFCSWLFGGITFAQICSTQNEDVMDEMEILFVSPGVMDREACYMCWQLALMIEEAGTSRSEYDFDGARIEIDNKEALERFDAACNILEQFADMHGATPARLQHLIQKRVNYLTKKPNAT